MWCLFYLNDAHTHTQTYIYIYKYIYIYIYIYICIYIYIYIYNYVYYIYTYIQMLSLSHDPIITRTIFIYIATKNNYLMNVAKEHLLNMMVCKNDSTQL